jgi:toxin CcdB
LRQFDVYETPAAASDLAPFVAVVQSHFLQALPTVLVAPMFRQIERPAYREVSVALQFAGEDLVLSLAEIAAIDRRGLTRLRGDLRAHEDDIRRALERVFTGF